LAAQLTREYGNGFSHSSLTRMAKFYVYLPEQAIVATLSQQLSWSHFVELERFILEMGSDFAFMSRQKRIQIGGNDMN